MAFQEGGFLYEAALLCFQFVAWKQLFVQQLFIVTCTVLERALFWKDDVCQEDEERPRWGKCWENTGGSRVQWSSSQNTWGKQMQGFYSCPLVVGLLYDLEKSLRVFLGWAWSRYLLRAFEKEL